LIWRKDIPLHEGTVEGNGKAGVSHNLILLFFIVNENCLMNDGMYIV